LFLSSVRVLLKHSPLMQETSWVVHPEAILGRRMMMYEQTQARASGFPELRMARPKLIPTLIEDV